LKKLLYIFIASLFLISCGSNDDDSLGFDKIIGAWKLVSNREDSAETVTDCTKKNTFNFTSKGILTRNLYVEVNSVCNSAQQEIASWYNLGNSIYRIDYSNGIIDEFEFNFTENDTKFSLLETRTDGVVVISTFKKE
jgi:hypothetical protein